MKNLFLLYFLLFQPILSFPLELEEFQRIELPQCKSIDSLVILPDGYAIADSYQHKILIYDKNFSFIKSFGKLKKTDDGFEIFLSMAYFPKNLLYISSHFSNVSIFNLEGNFLGTIMTDVGETVRSILYQNGFIILGIPKEPLIRIYKENKLISSFGKFPDYYKNYPSGAMISLASSFDTIYCALPLSYPILGFTYEGKKIIEIGSPDLMIKPYKTLDNEEIKDFKKISVIAQIVLLKNKIISVQLLPKGHSYKYAWDIFSVDGKLLKSSFFINYFLISNDGENLILQDYERKNRIIIAKIKE